MLFLILDQLCSMLSKSPPSLIPQHIAWAPKQSRSQARGAGNSCLLGFHGQFSNRHAKSSWSLLQSPLPGSSLRSFTHSHIMTPSDDSKRVFSDCSKVSQPFPGFLWTSDLLLSLSKCHFGNGRSSTWFCGVCTFRFQPRPVRFAPLL